MICWRIDIRQNFSRYLDGELDTRSVARVERHLLDCLECRARLSRIRDGHRFAREMPREAMERDTWPLIASAIEADKTPAQSHTTKSHKAKNHTTRRAEQSFAWSNFSSAQRFAAMLAIIVLLLAGLLVMSDWREPRGNQTAQLADSLDLEEFHEVSIADISSNTKPHVVAEGFVSEVRIDHDGDLTFRLVESLQQREPFIVCEIIEPIRLDPPSVGSRVRVYGVSRYDDQENHRWHEVHPVLNIQTVPR